MDAKKRNRLFIAAIAVGGIALFLHVMGERASAPVSSLIAKERDKLARTIGRTGEATGAAASAEAAEKLDALDYQLAEAYTAEHTPDKAVAVLERLIREEEARNAGKDRRSPRSYLKVSRYYEALSEAYRLQGDEGAAMSAKNKRIEMLGKAEDVKRREALQEGKTVGRSRE